MLIAPFEAPTHCWTSHCHRPPLQSLLWVTDSVGSWCAGLFSLFHYNWECSIEFPAEIPCYGVPSSISMGLLQVCGWITPPPLWWQVKSLSVLSTSGTSHGAAQGSTILPRVSGSLKCPLRPITPYQASTWPCVAEWHCHLSTTEEVRAGSPQHSRGGAGPQADLPMEGVSFYLPFPDCLTHQCLQLKECFAVLASFLKTELKAGKKHQAQQWSWQMIFAARSPSPQSTLRLSQTCQSSLLCSFLLSPSSLHQGNYQNKSIFSWQFIYTELIWN